MDAQQRSEPSLGPPQGETPMGSTHSDRRLPAQVGRYRILDRVGAGGMGTVYKAFDPDLERVVALKVPHFEGRDEDAAVLTQRFLREARTAALIRHPHVCPIYDVGEDQGRPYAVMAYVEGQSLADRLHGGRCYDNPADAVRLVREVADALDAVHARGLLHRDLKPGNILLDHEGHAILTDFGLARARLDTERLTAEGAILGTPAFMAPEQAAGQTDRIGPWTDVYGLGVVLYRLLTGRLPFQGDAVTVLWKIGTEDPPPPSRLRPGIDPGLEAIVLRAIARRAADRYASARDLGAALDHWLASAPETVPVRPDGAGRDSEGTAAATVAVTSPATRPDWPPALPATRTGNEPADLPGLKKPFPRKTRPWIVFTGLGLLLVGAPLAALVLNLSSSRRGPADGAESPEQPGVVVIPEDLTWPAGSPLSQRALVTQPAPIPGAFSWTVETREPRGPIRAVAYSPTAGVLACAGDDGMVRLWRASSRELLRILVGHDGKALGLAWSPDGRYLASAGDDTTIRLWEAASGRPLRTLRGHTEAIEGLSWSPEGDRLASASRDKSVRLWRVADGQPLPVTLAHPNQVFRVTWSPDGKKLATAGRDVTIRLWDAASGGLLHTLQKDDFPHIFGLAWSPDGDVLASSGQDCRLRLWDTASGQLRYAIDSPQPILALAWSPQGDRLATITCCTVRTWDRGGRLVHSREKAECPVYDLAWAQDGVTFTTAGDDGLRSYNKATGKPASVIAVHPTGPAALTWSPGGGELAVSGLGDGRLRLWGVREGKLSLPDGKLDPVAAWSPNGGQLAVAGAGNTVRLWEAKPGTWGAALAGHKAAIKALCWSADGKRLASGSEDGAVRLWDMPGGQLRQTLQSRERAISSLAWSGDGSRLAVGGQSGALQLWEVGGQKPVLVLEDHEGRVRAVAWSPDGTVVATAGAEPEGFVLLRKAPPGRRLRHAPTERNGAFSLAWSPDSKGLVAGGAEGFLRIWSKDGEPVWSRVKAHAGPVTALSWSPRGDLLASAGKDDHVRLWKMKPVDENKEKAWYPAPVLLPLRESGTLVVSPQGHWASSPAAAGQLVYVVQTEQGQQLLPPAELARAYSWSNDSARAIVSEP